MVASFVVRITMADSYGEQELRLIRYAISEGRGGEGETRGGEVKAKNTRKPYKIGPATSSGFGERGEGRGGEEMQRKESPAGLGLLLVTTLSLSAAIRNKKLSNSVPVTLHKKL